MSEQLQKEVIISVKTDTSQAEQDLKGLKDTLDDVGNTPLDKTVKSLKQQLKEAKQTAMELQAAGKMDTKEYQDAIKLIAKMKDEQDVLNRTVQAFDPGNKMSAFINIAKTATSAISGVAGAMTLFGVESEKAQQTIAQLQGLMALKDAIGDIGDFWKAYSLRVSQAKTETVAMGAAQKGQATATNVATVATKGLGMAFKALGIGLLISAVAYLVSNWESLRDALMKVFPALKDMSGMFDKVKQIAMGVGNVLLQHVVAPIKAIVKAVKGDFSDAMEEIKNGFNVVKNFNAGANAELSRQNEAAAKDRLKKDIENREKNLEVMKAAGNETYAYERKMLQDSLKLYEDDKEKKDEVNQKIRVLDASHLKQLADQRKQADEKAAQERKQAAEKAKQQLDEEQKTLKQHLEAIQKIEDDATKAIALSKLNDKDKELYNIKDAFDSQEKELKKLYDEDVKVLDEQLKRKAITQTEYNKEFENLQKQHNETHLALVEKKGNDDLEVEKKYNKILLEFIDSYQTSAFEQQKAKLIAAFDEKIALADGKQKELLEKLKDEQVQKLVTQETLRKETVSKETVLYDVKAENMALPTDDTQTSLEKLQNIWKAEHVYSGNADHGTGDTDHFM